MQEQFARGESEAFSAGAFKESIGHYPAVPLCRPIVESLSTRTIAIP